MFWGSKILNNLAKKYLLFKTNALKFEGLIFPLEISFNNEFQLHFKFLAIFKQLTSYL